MPGKWIENNREKIYDFLDVNFSKDKGRIRDAARYSVVNKNAHFWRPLLTIASGKAYGINEEKILPLASTPELFHTAALILDDLPSMDDADFRRGKPSCHKKFDVATTDLCFYYLIEKAKSFIQDGNLPEKNKINLLKASTETAFELIEGQKRDLYESLSKGEMSFTDLSSLYEQKTGAVFAYSLKIGGIVGNASKEELGDLRCLGRDLGVAYQIKDDILDVCGNEKEIGKPINQDKNKITIVDLEGVTHSKSLVEHYKNSVKDRIFCLKTYNRNTSFLEELVEEMLEI